MKAVETEAQYQKALKKIDELMLKIGDDHRYNNPDFAEMDRLSDKVTDYEDRHYITALPPLIEVIKLKMHEMGLKQDDLAQLLEVPKSQSE